MLSAALAMFVCGCVAPFHCRAEGVGGEGAMEGGGSAGGAGDHG